MTADTYRRRIERCTSMMREEGIYVLLLAKPSNMYYLRVMAVSVLLRW